MDATYARLNDGNWGIKVEGKPEVGSSVLVHRRDGQVRSVVVASVVWTGFDSRMQCQASLCTFTESEEPRKEKSAPKARRARQAAPKAEPVVEESDSNDVPF